MMERFYPIFGDCARLELLVPEGIKLVQLRIKDETAHETRCQIARARDFCRAHKAQLVVNDYWQMALDLKCDFVHLGQEDMDMTDFDALKRAGVRYGLSTHDETELERALSYAPEYVALGPIYPTFLKKMKCPPQGLGRVRLWKKMVGSTPLVAIGGLSPARLGAVFEAGADAVAVVSDIQTARAPCQRTREWIEACAR